MAFDIVECPTMTSSNGDGFVGLVLVSHSAAIASGFIPGRKIVFNWAVLNVVMPCEVLI